MFNVFRKTILGFYAFIGILLIFPTIVKAEEVDATNEVIKEEQNGLVAKVTITNNETGEVEIIEAIPIITNISACSDDSSITVGYEAFVPIDANMSRTTTGGSQDEAGVYAYLNVNYDVNNTNEKVRVNSIDGGWVPSQSYYYLTDRVVGVHSGTFTGKRMENYPTSDTFYYITGWDYNDRVWGDASPRAWSEAIIHIRDMTSTHTICIEFTFS